jgi:hypothetical protein
VDTEEQAVDLWNRLDLHLSLGEAWQDLHMLAKDREWWKERLPDHQADDIRHSMHVACGAMWWANKRIKRLESALSEIAKGNCCGFCRGKLEQAIAVEALKEDQCG